MFTTRVRVGSAAVWRCGSEAPDGDNETRDGSPPAPRIIGVVGGRVVTYERSQSQLVVAGDPPIDLPPAASFVSGHSGDKRFVLLWTRGDGASESASVLLVNVETRSVTYIPLPGDDATDIHDGAVDASGEHVVLFDAMHNRLWCWTPSARLGRSEQQRTAEGRWRCQELGSHRSRSANESRSPPQAAASLLTAGSVSSPLQRTGGAGVFTRSSLLGHCFTFVCAWWERGGGAVVVDKWLFDVDADWTLTASSSSTIALREPLPADPTEPPVIRLRLNNTGSSGALVVENTVISIKMDYESGGRSVSMLQPPSRACASCVILEQPIADLVWLDEGDILVLLLARGAR